MATSPATAPCYERRRPETTALYGVVRDNLETLYGAIDDGALGVRIPRHARKELEAYLDCGLLCRGFARLRCEGCRRSVLVAFSCKGRGFCPSCTGRRMCETSANLIDDVLPSTGLRQWVLTFPFPWRRRLSQDGALLGSLTRIFVDTVLGFYSARAGEGGVAGARTGALTCVGRTSSDMRLNPHLHTVALDGAYHEEPGGELVFDGLGHLKTAQVGDVLERTVRRITRHLRRRGLLDPDSDVGADDAAREEARLAASAVAGQAPPAGPQWQLPLRALDPRALAYDKPLCASLDGFTLHAATHAGAWDESGREALLRYVLRPPIGQDRVELRPDGLVRITLKKPFADGTAAVDMDPLSLLCRLAASVPPPRFHIVKCRRSARFREPVALTHRTPTSPGPGPRGGRPEAPPCARRLSTLGGAARTHVRDRRPHLRRLQRPHEAARAGEGHAQRRAIPARHG